MKRILTTVCAVATAVTLFAQNYQVVVKTTDGERKVFATNEVADIKFKDAPVYKEANVFIEGAYNPNAQNALYTFTIGTEEPDSEGQPAEIGGLQMGLGVYGPLSPEAQNAQLPEGYYRVGGGTSTYTVSASQSAVWIRYGASSEEVTVGYVVGGTLDVRYDGDKCDMRAEVDLLDGTHLDISFYGKMKFTVGASGAVDFDQDQNVDFTIGQGRVWANWFNPFCDDGSLQFFTGKFNDAGVQTEGYFLNVPFFMPKDDTHTADWTPVVPDGVYSIDPRIIITGQTYLPNTVQLGNMVDVFGSSVAGGTNLTYLSPDGRLSIGLAKEGTMTVSGNGTKFEFDFTIANGKKITGVYNGRPNMVNFVDNSNAPVTPDNLTADYELTKFPDNGVVIDYNLGDYIVPGMNSHTLMFTDPQQKKGDYLSLELFSDSEGELKDGVYLINNSFEDLSGLKGFVNFQGGMSFSWYGDLDSTDDEGYQSVLAPISGGQVTVTTLEGGKRKFDFDMRDLNGFKITGTITREVHYASDAETNLPKVERSRERALGSIKRSWGKKDMNLQPRTLMLRK